MSLYTQSTESEINKNKNKKKETNKQKSWNGSYAEEQGRQGVDMTQPAWLHQEQVLPDQSIGHP